MFFNSFSVFASATGSPVQTGNNKQPVDENMNAETNEYTPRKYATDSQSEAVTEQLGRGSLVEVEWQNEICCGIIRWIGNIGSNKCAGIELVRIHVFR